MSASLLGAQREQHTRQHASIVRPHMRQGAISETSGVNSPLFFFMAHALGDLLEGVILTVGRRCRSRVLVLVVLLVCGHFERRGMRR